MDITCKHGVPLYGFTACGNCEEDRWQEKHRQAPHPTPTLTCSEVVERLAEIQFAKDFSKQATAILHEWREQIRKGAKHE